MHVVVLPAVAVEFSKECSVSSFCRSLLPPAGVNSKEQQMSCNMSRMVIHPCL